MKKILILTYHLDLGGVEKAAVNLAEDLVESGYDVTLYSIYKFHPEKFQISNKIKCKNHFGFYFKGLDRLIPQFLKKSIAKKISAVDKFDYLIAFQPGLPHEIISLMEVDAIKYTWFHGIGFEIDESYLDFDRIYFVGRDIKRHYLSQISLEEEHTKSIVDRSFVVYNVIKEDEIILQANDLDDEQIKSGNEILFISVGRLSEEKQFDKLIKAFSEVNASSEQKLKLIIVGSGQEESKLKQIITELGLEKIVILAGFQKNPYKFLSISDVYVCSSAYEGFNIAMTEAAILGLPIISTNVYGAKELLGNNNEYGIVVEEEEHLSAAMKEMLNEKHREYYQSKIPERIKEFYPLNSTNLLVKHMLQDGGN